MSQPEYIVYIRVPIPRGDFVDPPPVHWDPSKDEALWRILSGAAQKQIDWSQVAAQFDVPVDFLSQQVAFLTERHASQVRAQVRKATAAAKGSAAPSPIPGSEPATSSHQRTGSALSTRRDSPLSRQEFNASGMPATLPVRPNISRHASVNTVLKDGPSALPRHATTFPTRAADQGPRQRLSSLPITSQTTKPLEPQPGLCRNEANSPGPAESSSNECSDDESSPAQSRIIRRPPRFQQQDAAENYQDDGDDESEPAFQPYQKGQDMASTVKGDEGASWRRARKSLMRDENHQQSHTSDDSSTGSPAGQQQQQQQSREPKAPGLLSPRQNAESTGRSASQEGSEGTPSMGSSFSDLDDASITQSALEEALASHMNRPGASSRFSISQAFRSRYFVNEADEIRSIENSDNYFKFFLNRNPRVNQRQRFAFDGALREIIHQRLQDEGLEKRRLPLGAGPHEPHVSVFASPDLASKTRVVLFLGEPTHQLGLLAGRVANGPGGINRGSMVSVVRELRDRFSTGGGGEVSAPAVVIANPGELYWWPEGRRGLTVTDSAAMPLPSLVHVGRRYRGDRNGVPGNGTPEEHVSSVFDALLGGAGGLGERARLSVVAVGQSCELLTRFLDRAENANRWLGRMDAVLLMGTVYPAETMQNDELKSFLAKRSRAYILSPQPLNTPLAPPTGNPAERIPALGSPCYSSSEPLHTEKILIAALAPAMQYLLEAATSPGYQNEDIALAERPSTPPQGSEAEQQAGEQAWRAVPEAEKPVVGFVDGDVMRAQVRNARRLRREGMMMQGGGVPDTDGEDGEDE
ncbi:hypothetical protein E4U41_006941 [Claviceps citrina]|nr:hypothetical protein E4U41_006941 [Claviceps citrina]